MPRGFFAFQSREPPGNAGVTLHVLTSLKYYTSRLRDYLWIIQYHWQRPFQIAYHLFFVSLRFKRFKVSRWPITKNKVCGLILKIIWINISLNFNFSKRCLLYQDLYRFAFARFGALRFKDTPLSLQKYVTVEYFNKEVKNQFWKQFKSWVSFIQSFMVSSK